MEAFGGLREFFYNIIPGVLFLFFLDKFKILSFTFDAFPQGDIMRIVCVLVFGAALGFFGQALSKETLKQLVNKQVTKQLAEDQQIAYKPIKEFLTNRGIADDSVRIFYAMDSHIRNDKHTYIISHFGERAAFWGNILLGSLALFLLLIFRGELWPWAGFFAILFIFSYYIFERSVNAQYDSILQTYIMGEKC